MKKYYDDELDYDETSQQSIEPQIGCGFCWNNRRKKNRELFFLDSANNMRICVFCPYCGRNLEEEK